MGNAYIIKETKKHPKSFLIWFFSIIFVIVFTGILATVIEASAFMFLRISEIEAGESDMQILPEPSIFSYREPEITDRLFIDYGKINRKFC